MVKLIAKKKIGFRNPDDTSKIVVAEPFVFSTLPDWVAKDPFYELAQQDGTIEVANDPVNVKRPKKPPKEA